MLGTNFLGSKKNLVTNHTGMSIENAHIPLAMFNLAPRMRTVVCVISLELLQYHHMKAKLFPCLYPLHSADCTGMDPHEHRQPEETFAMQTQNKHCFYVTSLQKCGRNEQTPNSHTISSMQTEIQCPFKHQLQTIHVQFSLKDTNQFSRR